TAHTCNPRRRVELKWICACREIPGPADPTNSAATKPSTSTPPRPLKYVQCGQLTTHWPKPADPPRKKTVRLPDGTAETVPSAANGRGKRWRARYVDES